VFSARGGHASAASFVAGLTPAVRELLGSIPRDRDIWDVKPEEYADLLGREGKASELWEILAGLQDGARHAGKYVAAEKTLSGERPRLIPIYNRERISAIPGITQRNIWDLCLIFACGTFRETG
jgi:hypothetical protein